MSLARLRFYEELNDFLPGARRRREFPYEFPPDSTVKHVIEALGVPHTEVDLVLVNGDSVDFSYRMEPGDRVSVYPRFESFDITPLARLRPRPLRRVRFLADRHLGALARYLRMLGFDTAYRGDFTRREMVAVASSQRRILLTRSRSLLMLRAVTHGFFVRSQVPATQLEEVLDRLHLHSLARPFRRCLRCNEVLEEVDRTVVLARLPERTRRLARFRRCPGCDRVYWEGSHFRRMEWMVRRILDRFDPSSRKDP